MLISCPHFLYYYHYYLVFGFPVQPAALFYFYIVIMQFLCEFSSCSCMLLIPEYAEISIIFYLKDCCDQESTGNACI